MIQEKIDEMLEMMWVAREEKGLSSVPIGAMAEVSGCFKPELIDKDMVNDSAFLVREAQKQGLVNIEGDNVSFTAKGEGLAKDVVRRHRLAERLLSDAFSMPEEELEPNACKFEHILSKGVTDSVCSFLGHPPQCPHGKPIPPGECCEKFRGQVVPLVMPLTEATAGSEYRITFIASKRQDRLMKTSVMGITPGSVVKVLQKRPSFVLQAGETTVALDEDMVKDIFVKQAVK